MPPFDAAMARRHKKGLSPKQVRQWCHVAQSAYDACRTRGGSASRCEASAIRQANGVTGTPAHPPAANLRRLTIETALTVPPSRLTLNNREYLTAPAVLIVEGVLNKGYIGGDQLIPQDWQHCCVVVNHPMDATGQAMSARSPAVLAQHGMGHLYHCTLGQGQRQGHPVRSLRAELYLDIAQVQALGGEALQALTMLEAQQPLELSTGFYSDALPQRGTFHGEPFDEVLLNLRPDHLALLPNGVGACSWTNGGCGAPRLAHQTCGCPTATCTCQEESMEPAASRGWRGFVQVLREFVNRETVEAEPEDEAGPPAADGLVLEQTDTDIREALYGCLAREMGMDATPIFIDSVDTATQSFTYRKGERLCRRYWTMEDGVVTLTGDMEDVQRTTQYTPVPGTSGPVDEDEGQEQEVMPMSQQVPTVMVKTRVNALIANPQSGWKESDRLTLERMDEAQLIRLAQQPELPPPPDPRPTPRIYEAFEGLDSEAAAELVEDYVTRKDQALGLLLANKACVFSEQELRSMTAKKLEGILAMMGEPVPERGASRAPSNYQGRRMPQIRVVEDERDGVPDAPDTLSLVLERQKAMGLR